MKIDIYQSTTDHSAFLSVPAGTDVTKLTLSPTELSKYKQVSSFKKGLTIDINEERIAMNSGDIIGEIKNKGYALHGADIRVDVRG